MALEAASKQVARKAVLNRFKNERKAREKNKTVSAKTRRLVTLDQWFLTDAPRCTSAPQACCECIAKKMTKTEKKPWNAISIQFL